MAFECFPCSECCAHLGHVHNIKESYGNHRFLIHNRYSGEDTLVTVDPDKNALFDDRQIFETYPHTCPLFRHRPESELACCSVHNTRPEICREYPCWRLLILTPRGRRVSKITYIRTLISDDPLLNRIWDDCIENNPEPDDPRGRPDSNNPCKGGLYRPEIAPQ